MAATLAVVAEFLFLALTRGLSVASERYKQRKHERATRSVVNVEVPAQKPPPSIGLKWKMIIGATVVVSIACVVSIEVTRRRMREKDITTTRAHVGKLADTFSDRMKNRELPRPQAGLLPDRDAWHQPIELSVDKVLLGWVIVVRSAGPDCKPGTLDDILAVRNALVPAKQIRDELKKQGKEAVFDRVERVLRGGNRGEERVVDEQRVE